MTLNKIILISVLSFIMGILITDYHSFEEQGKRLSNIYKTTNISMHNLLINNGIAIDPADEELFKKDYYKTNGLDEHKIQDSKVLKNNIQYVFYSQLIFKTKNKELINEFSKIHKELKKEVDKINFKYNTCFYIQVLFFIEPNEAPIVFKRFIH